MPEQPDLTQRKYEGAILPKLSRIHQKYLSQSLGHSIHQTQSECKSKTNDQAKQKTKRWQPQQTINASSSLSRNKTTNRNVDPFDSQIDHCQLTDKSATIEVILPRQLQMIQKNLNDKQSDWTPLFALFGLKSPSKMGRARAERELATILDYLRHGRLPEEYKEQLQSLVSN